MRGYAFLLSKICTFSIIFHLVLAWTLIRCNFCYVLGLQALNKKEHKNGPCSPDSPEDTADYQLTPTTERKCSMIDEQFQMIMAKNANLSANNNRVINRFPVFFRAFSPYKLLRTSFNYILNLDLAKLLRDTACKSAIFTVEIRFFGGIIVI